MPGVHGYTGSGVPSLLPFQLSYNGLTLGDTTPFDVAKIDGIDDLPEIKINDLARGRDTGEFMGAYFVGGRDVIVDIEVHDATDAAFAADIDTLTSAFSPISATELPLYYTKPGLSQASRLVFVRPVSRVQTIDIDYVNHHAKATLRMHATDPRKYDSALQSSTVILPTGNGGLAWPISWPAAWGSSSGSGTANILNAGSFETRPIIVINGPVDNPTIANNTTGQYLTFQITLGSTDQLTVDFLYKTVILNGQASRRNTMTPDSTWWTLAPGTSVVAYHANTTQVGSTATIYWQSAWN